MARKPMARNKHNERFNDVEMMQVALQSLMAFGQTNIDSRIYDNAVRLGVSVEGFTRRKEKSNKYASCLQKVKRGNGRKEQNANGNGAMIRERSTQNTDVKISELCDASNGCTIDVLELRAQLTSLELKVASMLLQES